MLRLNRYVLMLILWLSFLFNVERLDLEVGQPDLFNIASPIYVAAVVMVVLGLVLPQFTRIALWQLQLLGLVSFLVAVFVGHRPVWGGAYTYISLFELIAVLITTLLAYSVGRLCADFLRAVRALMFVDMDGRVYDAEHAEGLLKREMQFARRANRPLSVMVVDVDTDGSVQKLLPTEVEIQKILAKRHNMIAVTRLLSRSLRRTDFVVDQTDDGRIVLVMPEMQKSQTMATIARLNQRVQQRLGVKLRYGVASFPEQGVTFEELIHQAETTLRPNIHERRGDSAVEQGATDKLPIVEAQAPIHIGVTTKSQ